MPKIIKEYLMRQFESEEKTNEKKIYKEKIKKKYKILTDLFVEQIKSFKFDEAITTKTQIRELGHEYFLKFNDKCYIENQYIFLC